MPNPTRRRCDHVKIAAQKDAVGLSAGCQNGGERIFRGTNGYGFIRHDGLLKRLSGGFCEPVRTPAGAMDAGHTRMVPYCQMQDCALAKADQ